MSTLSPKVHAVILAGGEGTRLKPYTTVVPKPLMPVNNIPILEVVLRQLAFAGIGRVTIATGYLANLIEAFVGNGSRWNLEVDYSMEDKPLGTAGPIALIKDRLASCDVVLALNGDILTTLNYSTAIDFHRQKRAAATICVNRRDQFVDFGVIHTDSSGRFERYEEKPTLHYEVSMGINVFSSQALEYLKPATEFDNIPDLITRLHDSSERVFAFREPCYWLDIGRVDDYTEACRVFDDRQSEFLPDS